MRASRHKETLAVNCKMEVSTSPHQQRERAPFILMSFSRVFPIYAAAAAVVALEKLRSQLKRGKQKFPRAVFCVTRSLIYRHRQPVSCNVRNNNQLKKVSWPTTTTTGRYFFNARCPLGARNGFRGGGHSSRLRDRRHY